MCYFVIMNSEKSVLFSAAGNELTSQNSESYVSRRSSKSLRSKNNVRSSHSTTSSKKKCVCLKNSSSRRPVSVGRHLQLQQIRCAEVGPDIYRNVLGPTPDETVLAGLQTVIDLCTVAYPCMSSGSLPTTPRSARTSHGSSLITSGGRSAFETPSVLMSPHESEENLGDYPAERIQEFDDYPNDTFENFSQQNDINSRLGNSKEIVENIQSYLKPKDAIDNISTNKSKSV